MSEQTPQLTEDQQEAANQELLRSSEYGYLLERLYVEAYKADPRLSDIQIKALPPDSHKVAFARPVWHEEAEGKHEINIRLDNLDGILDRYENMMNTVPGVREEFAKKLFVNPEDMTPQLLYAHSILHEMGHLTEYMDYEDNPDELRQRNRREKAALPIGNATVSALMDPSTQAGKLLASRQNEMLAHAKVSSVDELFEAQHTAYRAMTSETHADNFAADVLNANPDLIGMLVELPVEDITVLDYERAA